MTKFCSGTGSGWGVSEVGIIFITIVRGDFALLLDRWSQGSCKRQSLKTNHHTVLQVRKGDSGPSFPYVHINHYVPHCNDIQLHQLYFSKATRKQGNRHWIAWYLFGLYLLKLRTVHHRACSIWPSSGQGAQDLENFSGR